jgi:hypothetical protein
MTERTMRRRHVMLGAGAVAGGVTAGGLAAGTTAQAGDTRRDEVTGSWLITHQDTDDPATVTGVASFAAGGVLINHDISPAGPPGTGTWAAQGGNRFRGTFWTGFPGDSGPGSAGPTLRVRVEGRVQRDSISGTYAFTVFDPSGQEADSGTGTFSGRRINA